MSAIAFIGDEVSALGYRLAGAKIYVPVAGEEMNAFNEAIKTSPLILITAMLAQQLPSVLLNKALLAPEPLVMIIPDIREAMWPVDLSQALRAQLGLEA